MATPFWAMATAAVGALIYALSFRDRSGLSVPIVSSIGKKFVGGALILCAGCVIAYWLISVRP